MFQDVSQKLEPELKKIAGPCLFVACPPTGMNKTCVPDCWLIAAVAESKLPGLLAGKGQLSRGKIGVASFEMIRMILFLYKMLN